MILEPFQYVEEKHVQDVRKFHVLKRLHALAAGRSSYTRQAGHTVRVWVTRGAQGAQGAQRWRGV
jgi:hypothetical protein